jgi:hypothetical protein
LAASSSSSSQQFRQSIRKEILIIVHSDEWGFFPSRYVRAHTEMGTGCPDRIFPIPLCIFYPFEKRKDSVRRRAQNGWPCVMRCRER